MIHYRIQIFPCLSFLHAWTRATAAWPDCIYFCLVCRQYPEHHVCRIRYGLLHNLIQVSTCMRRLIGIDTSCFPAVDLHVPLRNLRVLRGEQVVDVSIHLRLHLLRLHLHLLLLLLTLLLLCTSQMPQAPFV